MIIFNTTLVSNFRGYYNICFKHVNERKPFSTSPPELLEFCLKNIKISHMKSRHVHQNSTSKHDYSYLIVHMQKHCYDAT